MTFNLQPLKGDLLLGRPQLVTRRQGWDGGRHLSLHKVTLEEYFFSFVLICQMYLSKLQNVFVLLQNEMAADFCDSQLLKRNQFQELVGWERTRSTFVSQLQLLPPKAHRQCAPGERAAVKKFLSWILLKTLFKGLGPTKTTLHLTPLSRSVWAEPPRLSR